VYLIIVVCKLIFLLKRFLLTDCLVFIDFIGKEQYDSESHGNLAHGELADLLDNDRNRAMKSTKYYNLCSKA